jgi:membrane protein DedA with SNARE-associated domain
VALEQLLTDWGLPAVFIGSVLEGEGAAFMGGVLAHRRLFPFEAAALAAMAGAFVIDQTVFHIGRQSARFAFARRMLAKPSARKLLDRLMQSPMLSSLGLRFLYGLKTIGALALGAAGVPPLTFVALDLISTAVWAHLVTALGYGAGRVIEHAFGRLALHHHFGLALAVAIVILGGAGAIRRSRRPK